MNEGHYPWVVYRSFIQLSLDLVNTLDMERRLCKTLAKPFSYVATAAVTLTTL